MAEKQLDDGYWVCSSYGTWLPGVYESRKACRLAYRVDPDALSEMWEAKLNENGTVPDDLVLTESELRQEKAPGDHAEGQLSAARIQGGEISKTALGAEPTGEAYD